MAANGDIWYVRLPDGRLLHARSTDAMRRYLKSGRIPWESRVRRSAEAPWKTLASVPEFADLTPANHVEAEPPATNETAHPQTRTDSRTLGMRGLVEELFNAFDSSLQRTKLITAALTGLGIGVALVIGHVSTRLWPDWTWAGSLAAGFVLLVLFSICSSIITQMTALEMSRFRAAKFSEVRAGLFGHVLRLTFTLGLIVGSVVGLILVLRALPGWFTPEAPEVAGPGLETVLNIVTALRLLLEVICWPILSMALLLMGPILIVEEHSIWRGLREWVGMLRQHIGRIYLYQAIAFALAAVMTLPVMMPIFLASGLTFGQRSPGETVPFFLLLGVALTPMLSYLLVAHVFIYVNLRYEFFYSPRDRN